MLVVNRFSHKDLLLKTCNLHPHPIVEHAIEDLLLHILQHLRLISFGFFFFCNLHDVERFLHCCFFWIFGYLQCWIFVVWMITCLDLPFHPIPLSQIKSIKLNTTTTTIPFFHFPPTHAIIQTGFSFLIFISLSYLGWTNMPPILSYNSSSIPLPVSSFRLLVSIHLANRVPTFQLLTTVNKFFSWKERSLGLPGLPIR